MTGPGQVNFEELIPVLRTWNNGKGIPVEVWLTNNGKYELAIAFSQLFWPDFVVHEGCVFIAGGSLKSFDGFMKQSKGNRASVEAVMNHLHVLDLFPLAEKSVAGLQLRYVGRMLKKMWLAKLAVDFPQRTFEVTFPDEDLHENDWLKYQVTFWQPANVPSP